MLGKVSKRLDRKRDGSRYQDLLRQVMASHRARFEGVLSFVYAIDSHTCMSWYPWTLRPGLMYKART
jgi:hypothetical protein